MEPTRSRSTDNPSLIDLVLTNEVMQVSDIENHARLGKSDHCVITFKYHCHLDYSQPKERYVYPKTDFNSTRRQLVLSNWTEKIMIQNQSKSVDELWNSLKPEIHEIRNKFVPKQLSGIPSWKIKGSVPINQVLRDAIRNKSKLHRRWISSKNVLNVSDTENVRQAYTKARNKVKAMICKSKREFKRNIGIQSKSNPKIFWSYVRVSLKLKPTWHLSYRINRMKLQQNLTTRKRRIFFKNNLLVFLQKNRMLKCPFSIKKLK